MKLYVCILASGTDEEFDAVFSTRAETVKGVIRAAKRALEEKYPGLGQVIDLNVTLDDIRCKRFTNTWRGYTWTQPLFVSSDWKRVSEVPRAGFYPMIGA